MIKVISDRCPQNHPCPMVRACPKKAISQKGFNAPEIDSSKCIKCLVCVHNCAYGVFEKE